MPRSLVAPFAAALLATAAAPAGGQALDDAPRGVAVSLSATGIGFAERVGATASYRVTGATLGLTWLRPGGVGADAALTWLPPTGFHDLTGATADVGATLQAGGRRAALLVRAGASGTLAGDTDGGYLAGAGPFGGVGVLLRVAGRLALRADATARLYVGETPAVLSVGVGLALLPGAR